MGTQATAVFSCILAHFLGTAALADQRPFSAQDVMSVCVAVAHDPERAASIFKSLGWTEVPKDDRESFHDDLTIAYIGATYAYPKPMFGTQEATEFWQDAWPILSKFTFKVLGKEGSKLYFHEASGAVLLTEEPWAKITTGLSCLLAVPAKELSRNDYFPKLRMPTAPAVSLTVGEFLFSEIVRSKIIITSAALDAEGIGKALNISTDIGAAFSSDVSHPTWALEP